MFPNTLPDGRSARSQSISSTHDITLPVKAGSQKLRASCDSCYHAKIKCTKETPTCGRCLNQGGKCNYSPSQRTGKPKRLRKEESGQPEETYKPSGTDVPSLRSVGSASVPTRPFSWNFDPASADPGSGVATMEDSSTIDQKIFHAIENDGQSLMDSSQKPRYAFFQNTLPIATEPPVPYPTSDYVTDQSLPTSFGSLFGNVPSSPSITSPQDSPGETFAQNRQIELLPTSNFAVFQSKSAQPAPATQSSVQPDFLPSINKFSDPSCTCISSTFGILFNLHTSTVYPLTFPRVLSANSTAIADISHIFSCSCSLDSPSILLLAAVMIKILSSYRDIASSPPSTTPSANNTTITMGGYTLETGVDENHIKMHIVLSELKKVEGLLSGFQDRFCKTGRKGEQRICADLDMYMRRRLRDIVEAVQRDLLPRYDGV